MKKETKFLPHGHRYLQLGEAIKAKDYYWNEETNQWMLIRYDADTSVWVEEHVIRKQYK